MNGSREVAGIPSPRLGERLVQEALWLWVVFIALAIVVNGTIPFALGADLRPWTGSLIRSVIIHFAFYAGLFLVAPLVIVKGWSTVGRPAFFLPLLLAVLAIGLRPFFRPSVALVVVVLAYLHWRFGLSELGIRSRGWRGDALAVLLIGVLFLAPALPRLAMGSLNPEAALVAGLDRLFANPASTTEYLFYFGFLAERLSTRAGRWLTPPLIGAMYTAHEATNPEYWYGGMAFGFAFVGITALTAMYLWRGSLPTIWLGDGIGRALSRLS